MKKKHVEQLETIKKELEGREVHNMYFVACGGSLAILSVGDYFSDREMLIPSKSYTSNEFIHRNPAQLGEKSVVILRSHSGDTPETVEAANFARKKGATTIAISMDMQSPLCEAVDHTIHYNYKDDSDAIDGEVGMFYSLLFTVFNSLNPDEKYERVLSQLNSLDKLIKINKDLTYNRAFEFGRENKREKTIYTIASGAYYYDAYSFSSCLLMEMLWINSNAIHSGEYFHGPFEITDYDVPFLIIKGEGPSQSLDNRAINFAEKFSEKVEIVDISKLDYTGIDEDLKEYFGPAISGS